MWSKLEARQGSNTVYRGLKDGAKQAKLLFILGTLTVHMCTLSYYQTNTISQLLELRLLQDRSKPNNGVFICSWPLIN
jgi:hypothetical protein